MHVSMRGDEIQRSRGRSRAEDPGDRARLSLITQAPRTIARLVRAITRIERAIGVCACLLIALRSRSIPRSSGSRRFSIAGEYRKGTPTPARSIPTRPGVASLSTGTSTELDTHGREAALQALTPIREDRTQRGKCCVSSWSIRSHSSQVRIRPFGHLADIAGANQEPQLRALLFSQKRNPGRS
jgi:hypothetical protein